MKYIIFLSLLFLTSCSYVVFENPHPSELASIDKIPSKFHGSFKDKKTTFFAEPESYKYYYINGEFIVLNKDTFELNSDDLIIKLQSNSLYINIREDSSSSYYSLYVLNRFNYFGNDIVNVKTPFFYTDNSEGYDTSSDTIPNYLSKSNINFELDTLVADQYKFLINGTVNINQLHSILDYSHQQKFSFIK